MNIRKYKSIRKVLGKYYTISDLKIHIVSPQVREWREKARIAIIDDQGVPETLAASLRNKGFRIDTFTDVENVEQLSSYHVIISDVNGVASKISPARQGLGLIIELSKLYPQKSLAVYSGSTHKLSDLPNGVLVINKDDDQDVWTEKIDHLVQKVSSPINVWRIIAYQLLQADIPSKIVAEIEDDFVFRVINKLSFEGFPGDSFKISSDVQNALFNIVANSIMVFTH